MWIKDACKISRTALHWKYKAFLQGNNSIHSTCYRASIYLVAYPPLYSGKVANKDSFILLTNDWLVLSWACKPVLQKEFGVFWKKRASLPIREKAYHWAFILFHSREESQNITDQKGFIGEVHNISFITHFFYTLLNTVLGQHVFQM